MDGLRGFRRSFWAGAATAMLLPSLGCIGMTAQLLYVLKGNKVPPAFPELQGKRVAVVCVADASAYGPGAVPNLLAAQVETILRDKVKNIQVVGQEEVADWIDRNDWDQVDYREIGRGVKAQMVVAVDLDSLSLHDGQTLYKGRVNVKTTVYDISDDGKVAYSAGPRAFEFPEHTAVHSTDMTEAQFRRLFLGVLAQHLARHFHEYEMKDDFGGDARLIGR